MEKNKEEVAIRVENISKVFRIPHEKHTSLKSAALSVFEKKTYEEFVALKDVGFEVKKGEFFGIIGRNGSGKSTLLKILAGIYVANKGKIEISGKLSPFLELGVGFNPEPTARENVFLGGAVLGLTKKEIQENFDDIISFSELEDFVDMKFKNFSSGMQVRLAFALSIHARADILLMDEVLAVGDSNFQAKCIDEFNKYRKQGKTVVLVSHDTATIQRYCDRVMFLKNGKIKKIGNAEDVVNEYIKENIKEEEKRSKQESLTNEKNKTCKITGVKVFDESGQEKKIFKMGHDLGISVEFKKKKDVLVNIGIGIYKEDGSYVLGYNTMMDNYKITDNKVEMVLGKIPFLRGIYYINVVCFGEVEERYYDFKGKTKLFRVTPELKASKYRGVVSVDHKWR